MGTTGSPGRDESEAERDDRNLAELLQELRGGRPRRAGPVRVPALTAVYQPVHRLSHGQRELYLATLVLAAVATALLLGPVAYHRVVFRRGQKEGLVRAASVMAIAGLVTVGLAVSAAVLLVTGYRRQRADRGADHRVRHLRVRPAVVRVPARPPPLTRAGVPITWPGGPHGGSW